MLRDLQYSPERPFCTQFLLVRPFRSFIAARWSWCRHESGSCRLRAPLRLWWLETYPTPIRLPTIKEQNTTSSVISDWVTFCLDEFWVRLVWISLPRARFKFKFIWAILHYFVKTKYGQYLIEDVSFPYLKIFNQIKSNQIDSGCIPMSSRFSVCHGCFRSLRCIAEPSSRRIRPRLPPRAKQELLRMYRRVWQAVSTCKTKS